MATDAMLRAPFPYRLGSYSKYCPNRLMGHPLILDHGSKPLNEFWSVTFRSPHWFPPSWKPKR